MSAPAQHVSQMDGFVQPPVDPPAQSVWTMRDSSTEQPSAVSEDSGESSR